MDRDTVTAERKYYPAAFSFNCRRRNALAYTRNAVSLSGPHFHSMSCGTVGPSDLPSSSSCIAAMATSKAVSPTPIRLEIPPQSSRNIGRGTIEYSPQIHPIPYGREERSFYELKAISHLLVRELRRGYGKTEQKVYPFKKYKEMRFRCHITSE